MERNFVARIERSEIRGRPLQVLHCRPRISLRSIQATRKQLCRLRGRAGDATSTVCLRFTCPMPEAGMAPAVMLDVIAANEVQASRHRRARHGPGIDRSGLALLPSGADAVQPGCKNDQD